MIKSNKIITTLILAVASIPAIAQVRTLMSPDKTIKVEINDDLSYNVYKNSNELLRNSKLGIKFDNGVSVDQSTKVVGSKTANKKEKVKTFLYRTGDFDSEYNEMTLKLKNNVWLTFRAYDEGVAYRFETKFKNKRAFKIIDEKAEFAFADNYRAWLPFSTNDKKPMAMAFQATYDNNQLSSLGEKLAFLPSAIDCNGVKVTIMESDLEAYPGMFVKAEGSKIKGVFAKYPKTFDYYPWRKQKYVTATEDYIAKCSTNRTFPWRIIAIAAEDKDMPQNNMVYALASKNRIGDTSWIKPGLVAWEWWNDWNISGVDFKSGINMDTYKYYIDFASEYGLDYLVLDEGWYEPKSGDMLTTIPEINLPELVEYGKKKNVGLVLWTVFNVLDDQLEEACKKYSEMGIKGFKIDFLDRDDQEAVEMLYRIAEATAKHHLFVDLHGTYKPTGYNRTFPNIVNVESVFGMEEAKWSKADDKDMPLYDVTFPFIRQQCGFSDFTQGGMRNASRKDFQPVYSNPMTMGTRCHQAAMYVVYDSPFTMLADNPTAYKKEPEYTKIISSMPTVFDDMTIVDGKIGEYIITARQNGNDWYVGGLTNWTSRDISMDFSFLPEGKDFDVMLMSDGTNADKVATDYKIEKTTVNKSTKMNIHLASGGGFVMILK